MITRIQWFLVVICRTQRRLVATTGSVASQPHKEFFLPNIRLVNHNNHARLIVFIIH